MAITSAIPTSFKQELLVGTHNFTASSGNASGWRSHVKCDFGRIHYGIYDYRSGEWHQLHFWWSDGHIGDSNDFWNNCGL